MEIYLHLTDADKIYAICHKKAIYKAHQIKYKGEWAFISMQDSFYFHNGSHDSLDELLKSRADQIQEFDNPRDFFLWAFKNSRP